MSSETNVILALYPNSRGLGYACVEMPQSLLDSGILTVRPVGNGPILERVRKFTSYFRPSVIVVRDAHPSTSKRIVRLIADIEAHAHEKGIPVFRYSRQQIRDVFETFGVTTKYEIAQKIVEWFSDLAFRAPKIRKPWMDEDYNMGIFDALSLAITHQYLTE